MRLFFQRFFYHLRQPGTFLTAALIALAMGIVGVVGLLIGQVLTNLP